MTGPVTGWLALVGMALILGSVRAEDYTIQTIAVREGDRARGIVTALQTSGFDAYTESVVRDGVRWHRVRVGCFAAASDAEQVAAILRGGVTREAVVVARTRGAPHEGCLMRDVGFIMPALWAQRSPGVPAFDVTVAGVEATVRYLNGRWQVLQAASRPAITSMTGVTGDAYVERDLATGPFVVLRDGRLERPVCAGTLLASVENAVIVAYRGVVSACRLDATVGRGSP